MNAALQALTHSVDSHLSPSAPIHGRLEALVAPYHNDLTRLSAAIAGAYGTSIPLIQAVGAHHFQAGGKRLRPLMTLICSHMMGNPIGRAINLAACVELIHAASLVHDDVLDDALLRRGRPSVKAAWGNRISILAGDYLFCRAFACMVQEGDQHVYALLAQAAATMTEGELHQLSLQRDFSCTVEDYLHVIDKKTGALFRAACLLGGVGRPLSDTHHAALSTYGMSFGRMFQLRDDYLDYYGDTASVGKNIRADMAEGKLTFPILAVYPYAHPDEQAFLQRLFAQGAELTAADMSHLDGLFRAYDVPLKLHHLMAQEKALALGALASLPPSSHREVLCQLVHTLDINP